MKRLVIILAIVVIGIVSFLYFQSNKIPVKKLIDDKTIENVESTSLKESLKSVKDESDALLDSISDEGEKEAIVNRNNIINEQIEKSRWKDFNNEKTKTALTDSLNDIRKNCNRGKYKRIVDQCDTDIALSAFLEENQDFKNKLRVELKEIYQNCGW